MTPDVSIDREEQIAFFDSMLAGETKEQILLINAESGWGKSSLLREFAKRRPLTIAFGSFDFRVGGTSLAELFSRLCDKLGGEKNFPKFRGQLHNIIHTSLNITGNQMEGQNQINIYLKGRDEQERQIKLSTLTEAFFDDLRAFDKALLIFDTYEKGDEIIQKWLADAFLPRAYYSPNLYTVIGGQKIPEPTIEWDCKNFSLTGIPYEHWHQYAQSIGVTVTIDFMIGCHSMCNGMPLTMKQHIDRLALQRQTT